MVNKAGLLLAWTMFLIASFVCYSGVVSGEMPNAVAGAFLAPCGFMASLVLFFID